MRRDTTILLAIIGGAAILAAGSAVLIYGTSNANSPLRPPVVPPGGRACTMEAMQCADGSYVGRSGPDCEFSACPASKPAPIGSANCTSDADCPSSRYTCEATEGYGVVYPNNEQPPENKIIKGDCKLKAGNGCSMDSQCEAGLICKAGVCTNPQGPECGAGFGKCPQGFQCIQDCGPPVAGVDDPPPGYHCLADEIAEKPRMCPICLAANTVISTPDGGLGVQDVKAGDHIWSQDEKGRRVLVTVLRVSRTPVPKTHQMTHIVLSDGREARVSPNHPTAEGRLAGSLKPGDRFDGATVRSTAREQYSDDFTYDILPDSASASYWANGILFGSTLK